MSEKFLLLLLAADFVLCTTANPLQRLLSPLLDQNASCLRNYPALFQTPPNIIEPYNHYNSVQNPTCPVQSNPVVSNNEINQLVYKKLLENPNLKSLLSNYCCQNNPNGVNIPQQSQNPSVVNNYIIVPPEVFQNCPQESSNEIRKRRQDAGQMSERKRINRNQQQVNKPNDNNQTENHEADDEKQKRKRKRKQNNRTDENYRQLKSREEGRRNRTKNDTMEDTVYNKVIMSEPINEELYVNNTDLHHQDKINETLNENNVTLSQQLINTTENTNPAIEIKQNIDVNELSSDFMNNQSNRSNETGSSVSSKNNSRRRKKKRKSKPNAKANDDNDLSMNRRPANTKKDTLIQDFRRKFPNIPEDLIEKLIDYMRKQIHSEGSSISNAYYKYLNYPINFDKFYQTQLLNMANNPEIINIGNNTKRKSNRRNRKRKSKKQKNNNCSTRVELTPELIEKENETETSPLSKINATFLNYPQNSIENQSMLQIAKKNTTEHLNSTAPEKTIAKTILVSNHAKKPLNEQIINIRISVDPIQKKNNSTKPKNIHESKLKSNETSNFGIDNQTDNYNEKILDNSLEVNHTENHIVENATPIEAQPKSTENALKSSKIETFTNEEKLVVPEGEGIGEEDIVPTIYMNEVNDYFPNFEVDNFAYLLHDVKDKFQNLQDGRYHYTTDKNTIDFDKAILTDDKGQNKLPKILKQDKTTKSYKETEEIEETIQRPYQEESKIEFVTPPTLEVPDFETKPIKKEDSEFRSIFYDPDSENPLRNIDDFYKTSTYSSVKKPYHSKDSKSENKLYSNDIETISGQSKVVKYGMRNYETENNGSENNNKYEESDEIRKGEVSVVIAESYPW